MDEQKQSESQAKLIVRGFECSPEEITQLLGICPTNTWVRGETVTLKAKNVHKDNGWLLASPSAPVGSSIDEQVDSLLSVVTPYVDAFAKVPAGTKIELYCVLYMADDDRPVIMFSTDTIRILGQLGASIALTIYDFREI